MQWVLKQHRLPIDIGSRTQKVTTIQQVTAKLGHEVNVFLSDRKVSTTSFQSLAASFFRLAEARLSDTQKQVLRMSHKLLKFHELTLTALADQVSRRSTVPYSTVKWNLRSLKDMGLLTGGNLSSKGQLACLTNEARMLADYLEDNL
ncbi:MAG: hypothetical protein AM325_009345 [Candidatus Thorarchaeota archaeon SMTZ1-45]|nr:MAG: hypothetical protein AM325_10845 [Candidatus Thorarchaeota archaeon SMTZ1-45]